MKKIAILAVGALLAFVGLAFAQPVPVPQINAMGQTDLVQVIPLGQPSAQSVYAPPGAVGGLIQYSYQVPITAFSITIPKFVNLLYLNPAGTLATGTVTMPAVPGDGQRVCVESSQTQTALTMTANTGQAFASFGGAAVTALTANVAVCWFYNAPLAVWIRTS